MAANSKCVGGIASLGKQFVGQICNRDPLLSFTVPASVLNLRRAAHTSVYEKNPDEQIRPTVVPDDVIQPLSDKYWAPHPQTGVFGPSTDTSAAESGFQTSAADGGEGSSALEQKAWFRPTSLEDLEKPHHLP